MIGGVAIAAGLAKLVTGLGDQNDALAKASRRAGLTAQSYAELRFAFGLAGVTAEEFDSGLGKMNKSLGEAKVGSGKLAGFLKKSTPEFLKQLVAVESNEKAFDLLIGQMGTLKGPAERAAFAAAAFGSAGEKMTLVLEGGAKGLADARRQFTELHGVIDGKALKSSEDFVDAQARVGVAVQGVKQAIGQQLMPLLTPLLGRMSKWIAANRELIAVKVSETIQALGSAIAAVDWPGVAKFVGLLAEGIQTLWRVTGGAEGAMIAWALTMGSKFIPALAASGKAVVGLGKGAKALGEKLGDAGGLKGLAKSSGEALRKWAKIIGGIVIAAIASFKGALISAMVFLKANPIVLAITAIALAAGLVIAHWEPVKAFFADLWQGITEVFFASMDRITGMLSKVGAGIRSFAKSVDIFGILEDEDTPADSKARQDLQRVQRQIADARRAREQARGTGARTAGVGVASSAGVKLAGEINVNVKVPPGVSATVEGTSNQPNVPIKGSVGRRRGAGGV